MDTIRAFPTDQPWKQKVYDFAQANLKHSAWGLAHSERDYLLAVDVADHAELNVDKDVLFAAAFLHDMGGFEPYSKPGVDHAARSAEVCDQVLTPAGFPQEKLESVRSAIRTHSYYSPDAPQTPEAVALHDADALDFLGAIGVARILSLTGHETPDLAGSVKLVDRLLHDAPPSLVTAYGQAMGAQRVEEMHGFLSALGSESYAREHL